MARARGGAPRAAHSRRSVLAGAAVAVGLVAAGSVLVGAHRAVAAGLQRAADSVTDPRLAPGQFLRVTTLHDVLAQDAAPLRTVQVVWVPYDRRDVWVQRTTAPDGKVELQQARLGQVSGVLDYEAVEFTMRTESGFHSVLPDWTDLDDPRWSWAAVQWAQTILSSGEVPAQQRAWTYRWLADLRGVRQRGAARLASGRTGTVFAADDPLRIARWEIVVDTATGEYLGDRYFDVSAGTPPGGFCTDVRAISADIVDSGA